MVRYKKRYSIEHDNRLQKTTVGGMPLGTQYESTFQGELLLDHISTVGAHICNAQLIHQRKSYGESLFLARSVKCTVMNDIIYVNFPAPDVRKIFQLADVQLPAELPVKEFYDMIMNGKELNSYPLHKVPAERKPKSLIEEVPLTKKQKEIKNKAEKENKARQKQMEQEMKKAYEKLQKDAQSQNSDEG